MNVSMNRTGLPAHITSPDATSPDTAEQRLDIVLARGRVPQGRGGPDVFGSHVKVLPWDRAQRQCFDASVAHGVVKRAGVDGGTWIPFDVLYATGTRE